MGGYFLKI